MDNLSIGRKVARLRKERRLSTTELAARAGLSQPQISRLENGLQGFRSATLTRIAEALDVPVAYFFEEEGSQMRVLKRREVQKRRQTGEDLVSELSVQFGDLAVTPGYRQMLRRLCATLARQDCDPRTLRRLIDRVLTMKNGERKALLTRMSRK
jgi:transcriptional regulator with XRE-family HTH domain